MLGGTEVVRGHWEQAHEVFDRAIRASETGFPLARLDALPHYVLLTAW